MATPVRILVKRYEYGLKATLGTLEISDYKCYTLELPWYNNDEDISCVPTGRYEAYIRKSAHNNKKLGYRVVELKDVPNRTDIQIHIANRPIEIRGCIAVGTSVDKKQPAVLGSTNAMRAILERLADDDKIVVDIEDSVDERPD